MHEGGQVVDRLKKSHFMDQCLGGDAKDTAKTIIVYRRRWLMLYCVDGSQFIGQRQIEDTQHRDQSEEKRCQALFLL